MSPTPPLPASCPPSHAGVAVRAPGRLHLGFLDPSATLGRAFGSLGLVVDGWETVIELRPAPSDRLLADGPEAQAEAERAANSLRLMRERTGLARPLSLHLRSVLQPHAGFGSGTQLALAVGRAFAQLHGLNVATPTLAQWLGRGLRSGIGIAGFDHGGLLLDGGPGAGGEPAPMLSRLAFPAEWRILVAADSRIKGLSGLREKAAMATLQPLPRADAADLCHQVLMRVLPGVASADFDAFAAGLNRLQERLGEHFAAAQQGSAWTSPAVARLMHWLREAAGARVAIGQSSWGPTGFAVLPSAEAAQALLARAQASGQLDAGLSIRVVSGRNHGAVISEPPL